MEASTATRKRATKETTPEEKEARESLKEQTDELNVIVPNKETKTWAIGKGDLRYEYQQRPLSYFGKMEFFSLVGGSIDAMMEGEEGASVGGMLGSVGIRGDRLALSDFRDADVFIKAVAKVMQYAPNFLEDSYCIWLAVPRGDREFVKELMRRPEEEGGLSDEDGLMIAQTFIDQNLEAIEGFFTERLPTLFKRVQTLSKKMNAPAAESP